MKRRSPAPPLELSRRSALMALATLGTFSRSSHAERVAAPQKVAASKRPRAYVQLVLNGGMDAILTTDPKRKQEVGKNVDVPYEESKIVRAGDALVGPLFSQIARFVPKMAIVNGVQCSTVAHVSGHLQVQQMRRLFHADSLPFADLLGARIRQEAPLDSLWHRVPIPGIGIPKGQSLCIDVELGSEGIVPQMMRMPESSRRALAEVARKKAESNAEGREQNATLAAFLDKWPSTPKIRRPKTATTLFAEDILFFLEQDLARSFHAKCPVSLDTHFENLENQTVGLNEFLPALGYFLSELEARKGKDGRSLAETTVVLISSELGRFPILNNFKGKDHFPEMPVIMMGPGIRPGQYGRTDDVMAALPISPTTGKASSDAKAIIPNLDDIGTSLLRHFGIDDAVQLGHFGRELPFLFT